MMNQTGNQSQQQSGPVAEPLGSQSPAQEVVRYKIRHQTRYQYSENVAVCQNQVRMQPVSRPPCHCLSSDLTITPTPSSQEEHRDYFGNQVTTFSIESLHDSLFVECVSLVQVRASGISVQTRSPRFEEVIGLTDLRSNAIPATDTGFQPLIDEYKNPSRRVRLSDDFAGYARQEFSGGRPILLAALGLTQRIQNDFSYDTTTTDVNTPTEQAFQMRSGVCQDFAHVQLACLRSLGLPARYISGYLRTVPPPGKPRLIGADESHAWVELYAGRELGWVGLDPTNGTFVGTDHIPVCIGLDYEDVSPMRGVVLGGGTHHLSVSVDVEPVPAGQ